MVEAYDELFRGYHQNGEELLERTFGETAGYDDFVLVRDIGFTSHCEHHVMPFYGNAHIAYAPVDRVVGPVEAGAAGGRVREPAADAGASDRPDRQRDRKDPEAAGALRW